LVIFICVSNALIMHTMHIMTLFPASRPMTFLRCNLAALLVGLMVVALPVATQSPQRASAAPMTGFTQVTVGTSFTCALKSDQTVWCWGLNSSGQLGDGTTTTNRNRPVQVSGLTGVVSVDNQSDFACALKSDQTVWCWGYGGFGQLGNGATANSRTPVQVTGLSGVTQISTGYGHVCAVISDGTIRCWGWNVNQMLGNGTTTSSSTPISVSGITTATEIRAGAWQNCVLLANQTLTCWGGGTGGFRGDSNQTNASTKTSPTGISGVTMLSDAHGQHICTKLADQTVKCWGYNSRGQLGIGTTTSSYAPATVTLAASATKIAVQLNQQSEIHLKCFKLLFDGAKEDIFDNLDKFLTER
jgi:alpha-tubulin suppressor-like RCC1 family protein